jgi:hypothetical protein
MKKPATSYQERVRAAVEGMHSKIASDPQESEEHRLAARAALTAPTPTEVIDHVTSRAGTNRVQALRALRSFLSGEPVVNTELVIAPVADRQDTEPELVITPAEPDPPKQQVATVKTQAPSKPAKPAPYSQTLPTVRTITSPRYLDTPTDGELYRRADAESRRRRR